MAFIILRGPADLRLETWAGVYIVLTSHWCQRRCTRALLSACLKVGKKQGRGGVGIEVCQQSNITNGVSLLQCDINKLSTIKYYLPKTESSFLFNYKEHYLK